MDASSISHTAVRHILCGPNDCSAASKRLFWTCQTLSTGPGQTLSTGAGSNRNGNQAEEGGVPDTQTWAGFMSTSWLWEGA